MTSAEYSAEILVNSLGFRGPEISAAKKPGIVRVLFLGDSFTFGHGLDENETLPFLVGEALERAQPGRFEVVNGGVYGYSTGDQLNLLKKFGLPLEPDIVVVLFMTNDLSDNFNQYKLESGGILARDGASSDYVKSRRITRFIPGADWLRERSHLFKFVGVRLLPLLESGVFQNSAGEADPSQPAGAVATLPPEFDPEFYKAKGSPFEVTAAILADLARSAKEHGARPVMLTLAGAYEFRNAELLPEAGVFHREMSRTALKLGFSHTMALSPLFTGYKGTENLFFPEDTHWTGAATRWVAPAVAELIARAAPPENPSNELAGQR
ncbi:MAG: GDSL-type esterase/lipase family protein [Candidatus Binatia bacterium]